eukprot:326123-Amphidinium_carterae.1
MSYAMRPQSKQAGCWKLLLRAGSPYSQGVKVKAHRSEQSATSHAELLDIRGNAWADLKAKGAVNTARKGIPEHVETERLEY